MGLELGVGAKAQTANAAGCAHLVQGLIHACQRARCVQAVQVVDGAGSLPLHAAIRNKASHETVRALLDAHPEVELSPDPYAVVGAYV